MPKKGILALIDYRYQRCDEPSEFADHVIELLEATIDKSEIIKYFKSLSFWGDPMKAESYKRRKDRPQWFVAICSPEIQRWNLKKLRVL